MRSHVIVALIAFAAGALVVMLVVFARPVHVEEHPRVEPTAETSALASNRSVAADGLVNDVRPIVAGGNAPTTPANIAVRKAPERRITCVLGGYVRSSTNSRQPVPRAYVGLFQPAFEDDSPTSAFGQWGGKPERFPKLRQLLTWTYSDDDGKFAFDDLKAGTYIVRAELGPLLSASTAPQTLEPGEVRAGLDVALPLSGGLEGRILAPPGTSFDTWRVALQRVDAPRETWMSVEGIPDDRLERVVDDEGTFQIGPAAAGLHRVLLVWPGRRARFGQSLGLPIGEVMIVAGEYVKHDFDLRQGFPGSLNVTLHIPTLERDDTPQFHARIPYTITAYARFKGARVAQVSASCRLRETVIIGPLEPGTWALTVTSPISQWSWTAAREELIQAAQSLDVTLEVPLFEGTLTCLDAHTGKPLPETSLTVGIRGPEGESGAGVETDGDGRVHMQFPLGTYTIATFVFSADVGLEPSLPETFDWREDGPHPSTVKLLPPATEPR